MTSQQAQRAIQAFQIQKPIRGIRVSLPALKKLYSDLSRIIEKKADEFIATLKKPDGYTDEKFEEDKAAIRKNAFRVTFTLGGADGSNIYGDSIDLLSNDLVPLPLTSVFMTNNTAYESVLKTTPHDRFTLLLDFGKAPVFDWSSLVSSPTVNNSNLAISTFDVTFLRSVESSVSKALEERKPSWGFIHAPFAYDIGLWFVSMPYGIYIITKTIAALASRFPNLEEYKFALYVYAFVIFLSVYRFLFQYLKWVFPLNVYSGNEDSSTLHRGVLAAVALALFGNLLYDLFR